MRDIVGTEWVVVNNCWVQTVPEINLEELPTEKQSLKMTDLRNEEGV